MEVLHSILFAENLCEVKSAEPLFVFLFCIFLQKHEENQLRVIQYFYDSCFWIGWRSMRFIT